MRNKKSFRNGSGKLTQGTPRAALTSDKIFTIVIDF